ncbi:UDP-glucuronosyltransferase [Aphelenchoides fujianensis]|nr:UDP-glucuronosyltransferase [Aphelenchoides fujianensis]
MLNRLFFRLFPLISSLTFASSNESSAETTSVQVHPQSNGNVLIIGPLDTGTHMLSMSPFAIELAKNGYNVSIFEWNYTPTPRDLGPDIRVFHVHEDRVNGALWKQRAIETFTGSYDGWGFLHMAPTFNAQTPRLIELHSETVLEVMNTRWDLIVIHGMGIAAFFRKKYDVPYVIYSTTQIPAVNTMYFGLSKSPVATPYLITRDAGSPDELYDVRNFWHRVVNAWDHGVDLIGHWLLDWRFGTNNHYVGVERFDFGRFFRGAAMIVTDYYTRWTYPIPETTKCKNMATNCKVAKPLPADLLQFVEDPLSKGTIYIAFGTAVKWEFAPPHVLDAFFAAIDRLAADYRVVFAYNGPARNVSCNVKLMQWAPQFDILAHERTRVYVTHGGLKSTKEAVCARVPVVYMPLYAEQTYNSHMSVRMQFALPLNKFTVNAREIEAAVREMAENGRYKQKIVHAREMAADRPVSAAEEVLHGVRRAIASRGKRRHDGSRGIDFDNKSGRVFFYEHFFLEWIALLSLLLYIIGAK